MIQTSKICNFYFMYIKTMDMYVLIYIITYTSDSYDSNYSYIQIINVVKNLFLLNVMV